MNLMNAQCQVLAVVITVHHHFGVRCHERRFLLELILQQMNRLVHRFVEQPTDQTESEHVTALEHRFIIHAGLLERLFGQRRQRHRHNLHRLRDIQLRERIIGVIERFLQILVRQRIGIHDHNRMTVIERELLVIMRLRVIKMTT